MKIYNVWRVNTNRYVRSFTTEKLAFEHRDYLTKFTGCEHYVLEENIE